VVVSLLIFFVVVCQLWQDTEITTSTSEKSPHSEIKFHGTNHRPTERPALGTNSASYRPTITSMTMEKQHQHNHYRYTNSMAVLIGIDKYRDPAVSNLEAAERDVKRMKETIRHNFCGVHTHIQNGKCKHCDTHILTLLNEEATSDNIRTKMRVFLDSRKKGACDRLLFFYAGHGCITQNKWHMMSYDHTHKNATSGVAMSKLVEIAVSCKFRHILFVLDSCYSAHAGLVFRGGVKESLAHYLKCSSVQVLSATTTLAAEMYSTESYHMQGLLTTAFTHALSSNKLKAEGWMPIDELFTSTIRKEVIKASEHKQDPGLRHVTHGQGQFVIWAKGGVAAVCTDENEDNPADEKKRVIISNDSKSTNKRDVSTNNKNQNNNNNNNNNNTEKHVSGANTSTSSTGDVQETTKRTTLTHVTSERERDV